MNEDPVNNQDLPVSGEPGVPEPTNEGKEGLGLESDLKPPDPDQPIEENKTAKPASPINFEIVILAIGAIILAGIIGYFILTARGQFLPARTVPSPTAKPAIPRLATPTPVPATPTPDPQIQSLQQTGSSNSVEAIKADLDNSNFDNLDEELSQIEQELNTLDSLPQAKF